MKNCSYFNPIKFQRIYFLSSKCDENNNNLYFRSEDCVICFLFFKIFSFLSYFLELSVASVFNLFQLHTEQLHRYMTIYPTIYTISESKTQFSTEGKIELKHGEGNIFMNKKSKREWKREENNGKYGTMDKINSMEAHNVPFEDFYWIKTCQYSLVSLPVSYFMGSFDLEREPISTSHSHIC